jgi:hypothetical protein
MPKIKLHNSPPVPVLDGSKFQLVDYPLVFSSNVQNSAKPEDEAGRDITRITSLFDAAVIASNAAGLSFPVYMLKTPRPGSPADTEGLRQIGIARCTRRIYLKSMDRVLIGDITLMDKDTYDQVTNSPQVQVSMRVTNGVINGFFVILIGSR